MSTFETWSLAIAIAAVLLNAALFVGFGLQLRLLRIQIDQASSATHQDHVQRRKEATLEFVTATMDRFVTLRKRGLPELVRAEVEPFATASQGDNARYELIREYLYGYEVLGTGVNLQVLDVEVVSRLRGTLVVRTWELYKTWIDVVRTTSNPKAYVELEKMAANIRAFRAARGEPEIVVI